MVLPEAGITGGHGGELSEDPAVSGTSDEQEVGHLHFQPWLAIREGSPLAAIAGEVFASIPQPAITPGRKHRSDAVERRRLALWTVMANLAALCFDPQGRDGLAVLLEKRGLNRYDRRDVGPDAIAAAIHAVHLLELVTVVPGVRHKTASTLALSDSFRRHLVSRGASMRDVVQAPGAESILLRPRREAQGPRTRKLLDYPDDAVTLGMRADMGRINDAINGGGLCLDGLPVPPTHLVRIFQAGANPAWSLHGRLYRGLWLDMPRSQRHRLTLGGQPLADLDFSAMFTRLAYVKAGVAFPEDEDPYAVEGLEAYRPQVKQLLTSLFFRPPGKPARRLPKGLQLPEGWTMARFVEAVSRRHPALVPLFDTEAGFEFFAMESAVMVAVLLELLQNRVVGLPCHDGLLVAQDHKELAAETMGRISFELLGRSFPITEKALGGAISK